MSKSSTENETEKDLPKRKDLVQQFLKRHSLSETVGPIAILIEPAIYWVDATLLLLQLGYGSASSIHIDDPASGLLFNMLNRNFETVEGAIVSFLSGCGPTSELSSRAAIEFAVSITFILRGDRRLRLLAYLDHYISGVHLQIKHWRHAVAKLSIAAQQDHSRAIIQKEQANEALSGIVEQIRMSFGVGAQHEVWPNVAGRFEAVGASSRYRTVYARLSSQTHSDAEETLRYFVGVISGSQELMRQIGTETVEFTRMMLFFAVSDFVKASMTFASTYNWFNRVVRLSEALLELDKCLEEVTANIGGVQ
jgi:hypothetical protein